MARPDDNQLKEPMLIPSRGAGCRSERGFTSRTVHSNSCTLPISSHALGSVKYFTEQA